MRIENLNEFVVLSNTLNYRQASERLNLSQSTLSRHISSIEREFKVRLFDRNTAAVTLTDAGRQLRSEALKVLYAYGDLEDAMHAHRGREVIRIVAPIRWPRYAALANAILAIAERELPDVECRLVDAGSTVGLYSRLGKDADVVLACIADESWTDGRTALPLAEVPFTVWASGEGSPLACKDPVSLKDLEGMTYRPISDHPGEVYTNYCIRLLSDAGIKPAVGRAVDDSFRLGRDDFVLACAGTHTQAKMAGLIERKLETDIRATLGIVYFHSNASLAIQDLYDALAREDLSNIVVEETIENA